LGDLLRIQYKATRQPLDIIVEAKKLFALIDNNKNKEDLRGILKDRYGPNIITAGGVRRGDKIYFKNDGITISMIQRLSSSFIDACLTISDYVSEDILRFYFGKAREYQNAGLLTTTIDDGENAGESVKRIDVLDLPSLSDRNTRLLALSAVLATEWDRARSAWANALEGSAEEDERVPTFIVIDEAHNLIPRTPRTKADAALREQFRTLAAEGRKFGLFVILVSQRPDKLDSLVLSECQNKAIMKLGSQTVLETTRQMLGLEAVADKLDQCLRFGTGRVLLVGPWSRRGPEVAFAAARRTTEGGRDLRAKYWATEPV
jgi:ATPase family protein associated with various cellular activities (AAA)